MKGLLKILLLCAPMFACLPTFSDEHDWQLSRDEDNIRSYKSKQQGQKLVAFKSDSIIDAPIAKVLSVLLDSDTATQWIPRLQQSIISDAEKWPLAYTQFTRINAPWPVRDRVFLSTVNVEVDPESHLTTITYTAKADAVALKKTVLGSVDGSVYQLSEVDNGRKTRLLAISIANPNGMLPKWLVNWVSATIPHDTVVLLRQYLANHSVSIDPKIARLYAQAVEQTAAK